MSQPTEKPEWLKPREGAAHARVTLKQFRPYYKEHGLRHIRLPNSRILIKRQWIDEFLESFEVVHEAKQKAQKAVESLR